MQNIHMHAHLVECVREFGPISSFWCFSFERYVSDNSHFQLLQKLMKYSPVQLFIMHAIFTLQDTSPNKINSKKNSMFGFWT